MLQAYVVQEINGKPFNIILGDDFETEADAQRTVNTYVSNFGKCDKIVIEQAGNEIPKYKPPKMSIIEWICGWFD